MNRAAGMCVVLSAALLTSQARADLNEDACTIEALARVPRFEGLQVLPAVTRSHGAFQSFRFYHVNVPVDLGGRRVQYRYLCRVSESRNGEIMNREVLPPDGAVRVQ
jgi:hypothetical protein